MFFVFLFAYLIAFVECARRAPRHPLANRMPKQSGDDAAAGPTVNTPYTVSYFDQRVDHFNFLLPAAGQTFKQRVLYSYQYFNLNATKCPGPILFYTGNESPVTDYWNNSGFVIDILGKKMGAALFFVEHRFFGESLPFGNQSWVGDNIGYLTSDQALADYAYFLTTLKQSLPWDCPVFSFGGSYGGMLTAWFRVKYPALVVGGLAASAPVAFQGTSEYNPTAFMATCEETYRQADPQCPTSIRQGLLLIESLGRSSSGLAQLSSTFNLCQPLGSYNDAIELSYYVQGALVDMGMLDYPYATNYGVQFPGWPVNRTCAGIVSQGSKYIAGLAAGIQNFFNSTGNRPCLDIATDVPDWGTGDGWPILACGDLYFPMSQSGMWWPHYTVDIPAYVQGCQNQFNLKTRPNWAAVQFSGTDFSQSSNIIFSNGMLDPWHTSGILRDQNPSVIAIVIPEAAHHLDLRGDHPQDPIYVRRARAQETVYITKWIKEWFDTHLHVRRANAAPFYDPTSIFSSKHK